MAYNGESRIKKANQTKQKIYESAAKLFSSNDYNKVSVDAIVKLAGVAKGSFYVHFSSKEELIKTLIIEQVEKVDADYNRLADSFSDDVPTDAILLSLIEKIADVLTQKIGRDKMKSVYKAQITKKIDTGMVMSYNREIYKTFGDILDLGIRRGEFTANMPVERIVMHLMLAIRGITYEWCIRSPEFDYKAHMIEHFRLIIEGLSPPVDRWNKSHLNGETKK